MDSAAAQSRCHELVLANRILAAQNVLDAFGHVSVRHPHRAEHFLISRSMAPALVQASDLMVVDCLGNSVDPTEQRPLFVERFIHSAIYRARPDVAAIVHSHSPTLLPFGLVASVPLRPVSHLCGFLAPQAAIFDIRDHVDEATDLLIRDAALGAALAHQLGSSNIVLMRGHGMTVIGNTLQAAVFHAVYAERNAEILTAALRLGQPTYLSDAEAARCMQTTAGQIARAWDLWRSSVGLRADQSLSSRDPGSTPGSYG